jgi:hypothetical protein
LPQHDALATCDHHQSRDAALPQRLERRRDPVLLEPQQGLVTQVPGNGVDDGHESLRPGTGRRECRRQRLGPAAGQPGQSVDEGIVGQQPREDPRPRRRQIDRRASTPQPEPVDRQQAASAAVPVQRQPVVQPHLDLRHQPPQRTGVRPARRCRPQFTTDEIHGIGGHRVQRQRRLQQQAAPRQRLQGVAFGAEDVRERGSQRRGLPGIESQQAGRMQAQVIQRRLQVDRLRKPVAQTRLAPAGRSDPRDRMRREVLQAEVGGE